MTGTFDQTSYMCTIYAIGIYQGHSNSQLSLKSGVASLSTLKDMTPNMRKERAYRQAMDWIGNCFVKNNYGDVIAIATTLDESTTPHKITFHISNNIGQNRSVESKKEIWPNFLHIMNTIKYMNLSLPENLKAGSQLYVRHIIGTGWPRVQQKFSSINAIISDKSISFDGLLQKLHEKHCITTEDIIVAYPRGDTDTDASFLEAAMKSLEKDMITLTTAIQEARSKTNKYASTDKYLEIYNKGIKGARPVFLVINSILDKHRPEEDTFWKENQQLKRYICKLHNRLSRLLKFESGAKVFLKSCLEIYQKFASVAQSSELLFEAAWVEDCIEDSGLPTSELPPLNWGAYLSKLEATKNRLFADDMNMFNSATYENLCTLLKETIDKKKNKELRLVPSLHCEISLALYLEAKNLTPLYNFIGVTKLNCASCSRYSQAYSSGGHAYQMTGSSGKWHHNWFMPTKPAIRGANILVLINMQERMNEARHTVLGYTELELKNILSRRYSPGSSVGSDSTTGSMNPFLLQSSMNPFLLQEL